MTDIVQRLRLGGGVLPICYEAANEIARLRLELAEARRALEISRSNAVIYDGGVLIAAFDQYGRQIYAHKVVTL